MKTVGLITEYNPFHNGHLYHIEQAKKLTSADAVIVVMSGDFVQRGTPAIMPKYLRAEMALRAGASVVFELPVCYATGSAEYFAMGAISFFQQLGCIDTICFGTECGSLLPLNKIAHILLEEPLEYQSALRQNLKMGMTFPAARKEALITYLDFKQQVYSEVLESSNNILGIEYLKALKRLNSNILPFTIKRIESHYHDTELQPEFSSASAIRKLLDFSGNSLRTKPSSSFEYSEFSNVLAELRDQVPSCCLSLMEDYHQISYPIYSNDYSLLLKYKLMSETPDSLFQYLDISMELANRIMNQLNRYFHFEQFCELLKTKDTTYTRISRAMLHILLGIKKMDVENYAKCGYHFYAHMLGFRKDAKKILSLIKKNSSIPVLTKLSSVNDLPSIGLDMLNHDIYCSNLYESVIVNKFSTAFVHECEQSIILV